MKKTLSLVAALVLLLGLTSGFSVTAENYIDNSDLTPKWYPVEEAELETSKEGLDQPDWLKTLIMAEVRIETASTDGTFAGMTKALDHYEEMGVNGLWVTPIYDSTDGSAHYGNNGPHTVSRDLTGKQNYEEGWKVVKAFVDEAHKRNIRVLLDIVVWGTNKDSPLVTEHPEYYEGGWEAWGGYTWVWRNKGFIEYYTEAACNVIRKTGADGFRVDLEPTLSGYFLFEGIRERLYNEGKYVAIMSEGSNTRQQAYDFEQGGVNLDPDTPLNEWGNAAKQEDIENYFLKHNIVDSCKTGRGVGDLSLQKEGEGGRFRFYTFNLTCHDHNRYLANGNALTFGYQMIYAPFIPLWFIGEEFNNRATGSPLYYSSVDWGKVDENRSYFERTKRMIRVRRSFPEIFEYFPDDHRNTNICKVTTSGTLCDLQAYARYADGKAVLVVPNDDTNAVKVRITIPWADAGLSDKGEYAVTDLYTGKELARGTADTLQNFRGTIEAEDAGAFLVAPAGTSVKPTTAKPTTQKPTTAPVGSTAPVQDETTAPVEGGETTAPVEDETTAPVEGETTAPVTDGTTLPTTAPTTAPVEDAQTMPGFDAAPFIIGGIAVAVIAVGVVVLLIIKKKKA